LPVRLVSLNLPDQREVLGSALADAVDYHDPPLECSACGAQEELCDSCAAGLARARAYLALARELGVELPR
jgi:hypothetical protein